MLSLQRGFGVLGFRSSLVFSSFISFQLGLGVYTVAQSTAVSRLLDYPYPRKKCRRIIVMGIEKMSEFRLHPVSSVLCFSSPMSLLPFHCLFAFFFPIRDLK
jgi:hypothetical protein